MDATVQADLEQAVRAAAAAWQPVSGGDPNTIDLLHHALLVQDELRLQLPTMVPAKADGVAIVELVERLFVRATLIRHVPLATLADGAVTLVDAIACAGLHLVGRGSTYVTALYAWHGCINMAKLLRPTHNVAGGQAAYTDQMRTAGYAWLADCWTTEEARGNPWVRYGVTLARPLEQNRKGTDFGRMVIEDWVPADSPYWVAGQEQGG
jgi:hypothetical protein